MISSHSLICFKRFIKFSSQVNTRKSSLRISIMLNKFKNEKSSMSFDYRLRFNTHCGTTLNHQVIDEDTVYESDFSTSSSLKSGWGSVESRKSYKNLTSLVEKSSPESLHKRIVSPPVEDDGWGYFVDTKGTFL